MVKISFVAAVLMLVSVASFSDIQGRSYVKDMLAVLDTKSDVKNFVNGLIQGLKKSQIKPSECAKDFDNADGDFMNLLDDFVAISSGDFSRIERLYKDATKLFEDLKDTKTDCDYSELVEILESLRTNSGRKAIQDNYRKHEDVITDDLATLLKCSADYNKCGRKLGEVVRLLLGWGL